MGPKLVFVTVSVIVTDADDVDDVFAIDDVLLFSCGGDATLTALAVLVAPPMFVVDFIMKNFSNLAIMCLPYVYLRNEFMCGRILFIKILRWVGSDTSIIFCNT